jgi:GTP-binding protein
LTLKVKEHWQQLLEKYLHTRESLQGLILMMDIRHPLTEFDQQMLLWCQLSNMPVHILLTKADKLSHGKGCSVLELVKKHLANLNGEMSVQLFSAMKKSGIEEVQNCLDKWLANC